jgi:pyridoxal 5'-phosphate synthase pdxT subunit
MVGAKTRIGVVAVQGDFDAHRQALDELGVDTVPVRTPAGLEKLDGVILPGGESGAHLRILHENGLFDALRVFHAGGGAFYGTCAGLILLARNVSGPAQESLGLIDLDVVRNGYGRQIDSFEALVTPAGALLAGSEPFRMVFIRAPRITRTGPEVEILLRHEDEPVAAREGRVLVTTFHPEMTGDRRMHRYFVERVVGSGR